MPHFHKIAMIGSLALIARADAVGLLPTPVLDGVQISASATFDPTGYTYSYMITNPARNTGEITSFWIDVTARQAENAMAGNTSSLTIPLGSDRVDFTELLSELEALNSSLSAPGFFRREVIVPFGQNAPTGWNGGLGMGGFASFSADDDTRGILPGAGLAGFQLRSFGVPTIRSVNIIPLWMFVVADHEQVTPEEIAAADQVEQDIVFPTRTLAASGVSYGSFAHWNQLRDDLAEAIQLGWIRSNKLARTLTSQLASARQAFDARDNFTAKVRLAAVLATIDQAPVGDRTSEGFALVDFNVRALINNTPDNEVEPRITISPKAAALSIGAPQSFTATLIDLANGGRPIADQRIAFHVEGPNGGGDTVRTDAQGHASFSYVGSQTGTDVVVASALFHGGEVSFDDSALVQWAGGIDLIVPLFVPPLLRTEGGRTFYVTEQTQNIGNLPSPPTTTRYYLSSDAVFDPSTARLVGERTVPALLPDQSDGVKQQAFTMPSDLPPGVYFLAACADASNLVVEVEESNNCSFVKVQGRQTFVVPVDTPNHSPVCTSATPSIATLWPPNHKLVDISVQGVTDAEHDPITVQITGITQDEPVNGDGDGNTSPDGFGIGTAQAQLRSERSGLGNGRVYAVSFTASDGKGGSCTGTMMVGVPHDQGQGAIPIDDGQIYDSTVP
ncbi:MAG: hypothetical protein E6J91_22575 [Deltaproteobacteria bacterium]|nr:MAG: hypothetical protein E6J91_22575 [Deltaproteobacteria bacterium]